MQPLCLVNKNCTKFLLVQFTPVTPRAPRPLLPTSPSLLLPFEKGGQVRLGRSGSWEGNREGGWAYVKRVYGGHCTVLLPVSPCCCFWMAGVGVAWPAMAESGSKDAKIYRGGRQRMKCHLRRIGGRHKEAPTRVLSAPYSWGPPQPNGEVALVG